MLPRDNPFAMDRLGRFLVFRPDWSSVTWEEILPSADALNRLGDLSDRCRPGRP